mgnify:CR=1 FL=1
MDVYENCNMKLHHMTILVDDIECVKGVMPISLTQ